MCLLLLLTERSYLWKPKPANLLGLGWDSFSIITYRTMTHFVGFQELLFITLDRNITLFMQINYVRRTPSRLRFVSKLGIGIGFTTRNFVVNRLGIGVGRGGGDWGTVKWEWVEKTVNRLMVGGEEVEKMRERVSQLGELAKPAVVKDGSILSG